jgi:hypothetical protein
VSNERKYSTKSASARRRKKHYDILHHGFELYDDDVPIAQQVADWTPMADIIVKIFRLLHKPVRDFRNKTLAEVLDLRVPDANTEIATFPLDARVYERFIKASRELLARTGTEPGADRLIGLVASELSTEEIIARAEPLLTKKSKPTRKRSRS